MTQRTRRVDAENPLTCPTHRTEMYYWPAGDSYACQDVTCEHAHGVTFAELMPFHPIFNPSVSAPATGGL